MRIFAFMTAPWVNIHTHRPTGLCIELRAAGIHPWKVAASGAGGLGRALDELDPDVARARALDPVAALGLPALAITDDTEGHVLCGRRLSPALITHRVDLRVPGARFCLLAHNELRAIAQFDGRAIRMEDVFPQPVGGVRQ